MFMKFSFSKVKPFYNDYFNKIWDINLNLVFLSSIFMILNFMIPIDSLLLYFFMTFLFFTLVFLVTPSK